MISLESLQIRRNHNLLKSLSFFSSPALTGSDTKGQPIDLTVRVTDVYRKIKGKWLVVHEHVSVPVDLNTGKPDMSSKP